MNRFAEFGVAIYSKAVDPLTEIEDLLQDVTKAVETDPSIGGLTFIEDRAVVLEHDRNNEPDEIRRGVESWTVTIRVPYVSDPGEI